jgi:glycolate oxidase
LKIGLEKKPSASINLHGHKEKRMKNESNQNHPRHTKILEELQKMAGPQYVSDGLAERFIYHWDFVTCSTPPGTCEFVVMPADVEQVAEIVRLANREKIPVVPLVSGMNFGGLAIPRKGGIVVDLRRMNKVIEVHEDDMYALVEGGITWGDLQGYLQRNHPSLRAGITYSPPSTGVIPAYLEHGMLDISNVAGSGSHFLNGLEVVLPTGKIVKTGTAMFSRLWYGRPPTPDISGCFIGWSGTSGIVTKASIRLWPNWVTNPWSITAATFRKGIEIEKVLFKTGFSFSDVTAVNHSWGMMMKGFYASDLDRVPYKAEEKGFPDYFGTVRLYASSEKEMAVKVESLVELVGKMGGEARYAANVIAETKQNELGTIPLTAFELPLQAFGTWNFAGGGGEWCGVYTPLSMLADYYEKAREISVRYGKHGLFYHRGMDGGHSHVGRLNIEFNKGDADDVQNSRKCLMEIDDLARDMGLVRYKAPYWAAAREVAHGHPDSIEFLKQLKKLMDPEGIMNPGQSLF